MLENVILTEDARDSLCLWQTSLRTEKKQWWIHPGSTGAAVEDIQNAVKSLATPSQLLAPLRALGLTMTFLSFGEEVDVLYSAIACR